ncbi:hypothetical protein [Vannielia sp.]|uniref:hypothetical protein n=1 Tax=Vannielia sp. TaxID=2813045 RepID=UPI003BAB029B
MKNRVIRAIQPNTPFGAGRFARGARFFFGALACFFGAALLPEVLEKRFSATRGVFFFPVPLMRASTRIFRCSIKVGAGKGETRPLADGEFSFSSIFRQAARFVQKLCNCPLNPQSCRGSLA